jgi:ketosteroid isomerase-like protein
MANEEKQQIKKLLNLYKNSINTFNVELVQNFYSKDAILSPEIASKIGTENVLESFERLVPKNQYLIDFFIEEIAIEENMAYAITSSKETFQFYNIGSEAPEVTRIIFLLTKADGEWKIIRHVSNDVSNKNYPNRTFHPITESKQI